MVTCLLKSNLINSRISLLILRSYANVGPAMRKHETGHANPLRHIPSVSWLDAEGYAHRELKGVPLGGWRVHRRWWIVEVTVHGAHGEGKVPVGGEGEGVCLRG